MLNERDPEYANLKAGEESGASLMKEQLELKTIAARHGNPDAFEYGWDDHASDFFSRNDEWVTRGVGAGKMAAGSAWAVGSGVATVASAAAMPATGGLSGFGVAGFGTITGLNVAYVLDRARQLGCFGPSPQKCKILHFTTLQAGWAIAAIARH